jgi:hypothetical protein
MRSTVFQDSHFYMIALDVRVNMHAEEVQVIC